jgi:hypothetical protein
MRYVSDKSEPRTALTHSLACRLCDTPPKRMLHRSPPPQVVETRDWRTSTHSAHRPLPMGFNGSKGAGMESRFGVVDEISGRIKYLPTRYGTAEALGTTSYEKPARRTRPQHQQQLKRTPTVEELDQFLLRRSRVRGRGGGDCSRVLDKVQSKWSVIYGASSCASVSMIPK